MASDLKQCLQSFDSKPRVFIVSDISNEPDDAESLVRYLLYSNQFETEGLVAVTSNWMKRKTCPQDMEKIVKAYGNAVDNLNAHAHPSAQYPSAEYLLSLIRSGPPLYGFEALEPSVPLSPGSELLLERILAPSDKPLWVLVWGGTNVIAQVLDYISKTYSTQEAAALRAKLRIYTISDQDDTSAWIRTSFPDIFYISSVHGWNHYGVAAWTGISGERFYGFDQGGPDFTKLEKTWIKENVQIGPLGSAYPDYMFIPEGDTPTFLYLIQNGLGVPEEPEYGSWGGRYSLVDRRVGGARHHSDAVDTVIGADGRKYKSNHAAIWRWRDAFQNDFAARIQWTLSPELAGKNHHPVIAIDGVLGTAPVHLEAEAGTTVTIDASQTRDPDGDDLTFKWWHYREPSATQSWVEAEVAELEVMKLDEQGRKVEVKLPPPEKCAVELISRKAVERGQLLHLILEVTDSGTPALTSYRRILIQTTNKDLKGGGGGGDAVGDIQQGEI